MKPTLYLILFLTTLSCYAQEETARTVSYGKHYIEINTKKLDRYYHRISKEQSKLLKKLSKKETKMLKHLKRNDSVAYVRMQQQRISYDSLVHSLNADSATKLAKTRMQTNRVVDSLKKIQGFISKQASALSASQGSLPTEHGNIDKLNRLETNLNYQQYIQKQIDQKAKELTRIGGDSKWSKGIQKDIFYSKAKMKSWKQLADDPDKAEEKALEWLQGTEGFDQAFQQNKSPMQSATSVEDLERMGFQTKRQVNKHLQQKFGDNLSKLQENMGSQVKDWQTSVTGLGDKTGNIKQTVNEVKETKNSLQKTKAELQQSPFRVNPMKGLPFRQRWVKSYTYQTRRATPNGSQPAVLELAVMTGYKHSPRLTSGIGIAANIGLGQDWNNINISLQGIGFRTFIQWEWKFGVGAYAGYERLYRRVGNWNMNPEQETIQLQPTPHHNDRYSEAVLIGLTKQYRLNSKWNGAVQVLYDVWWQDKGARSPFILRFVTSKM
ncbi:hypothetical protein [Parapedobacter sp. 10938]|uniref:hypothetical protein n=1 Tax=Parapedobacter flavus TaxID=3110225 RepID=UPI002DBCC5BB|nr:hypothetical protein [Parapedobacter sp. 10938]MEC3880224.1 hypothetical protein [Parapedobacter sp. 10938]